MVIEFPGANKTRLKRLYYISPVRNTQKYCGNQNKLLCLYFYIYSHVCQWYGIKLFDSKFLFPALCESARPDIWRLISENGKRAREKTNKKSRVCLHLDSDWRLLFCIWVRETFQKWFRKTRRINYSKNTQNFATNWTWIAKLLQNHGRVSENWAKIIYWR